MKRISKTAGVIAISSMLLPTAIMAGEAVKVDSIEVYSPTSLPTIGLPVKDVPFAVQTATGEEIREQPGVSIADYMVNNLEGVTVNEVGGNPYQLEVNYRGYSNYASCFRNSFHFLTFNYMFIYNNGCNCTEKKKFY
jgi:outer membrane receptor protein involved in Fe transport